MFYKRLCFTFLELLIVIAILSLIAGFVGINIRKAVSEQNFRSEVELVVNQLRQAQDLMLIFRGEVIVKFTVLPDGKGLSSVLEFEAKMPANWDRETKRVHKLKYIHGLNFQDQMVPVGSSSDKDEENTLEIKFFSNGSTMSKGIIELSNSSNPDMPEAITRYINLPGYPSNIVSSASIPQALSSMEEDEAFNKDLTYRTAHEVQFLNAKASSNEAAEEKK